MASLQLRGTNYRVYFNYKGQQRTFSLGEVSATEAAVWKAQAEELLRLLKRNLVSLLVNVTIEQFLYYRGNPPPEIPATAKKFTTAGRLPENLQLGGSRK